MVCLRPGGSRLVVLAIEIVCGQWCWRVVPVYRNCDLAMARVAAAPGAGGLLSVGNTGMAR